MPTLRLNGFDAYYEVHGDGEPLVLVHGYTGDLTDWEHQIRAFSPRFRVVAMDNRGHGRSTAPPPNGGYTVEQMADDLRLFLDALGLEGVHLAGHSLGGMVAQAFAVEHGGRLRSLTLVDTSPEPLPEEAVRFRERAFEVARTQGMAAVPAFQEQNRMWTPPIELPPAELERNHRRLAGMDPAGYVGAGRALAGWRGRADRLGEIRVPALVVVGEHDSPYMQRGAEVLAQGIPGARLALIRGAAHTPQREATAAFNEAMASFLDAVTGGAAE